MTRYSLQLRDWIFVKGYGFLSFTKNMGKNIGKNISQSLSAIAKNSLIIPNNLQKQNQQQKYLVIWPVIKLLIELQKFQKIHNKII